MSLFQMAKSPFTSDNTASNMCGVTLMNNQIGVVVAEVMRDKPGVRVTPLPSMIRVDAANRMDFVYDEISEALGEEPGFFDAAEFEESMSTHYGRMIHEDDRTIMFANPEDAAEYIGFDLVAELAKAPGPTVGTSQNQEAELAKAPGPTVGTSQNQEAVR
ncbi:MAG: propane monooxygenase coupling protein [Actinoplanes sp.]|nr:propane monooxygenase coupling protein [Actinoplanes sp.]